MSDYSQVNETNHYFSNSVVVPQGYSYSNIRNSYTVPQSFQNSAYYKFKNVPSSFKTKYENGSDMLQRGSMQARDIMFPDQQNTNSIKGFKSPDQIKDRGNRQQLNIAEGSQGLKFARIARAIDQLQTDVRCPFNQYYDGEKCVDNMNACPTSQYYEPLLNSCMPIEYRTHKGVPSLNNLTREISSVSLALRMSNKFNCLPLFESYDPNTSSCVDGCDNENSIENYTIGGYRFCLPKTINDISMLLMYNPLNGAYIIYDDNTYKIYMNQNDNQPITTETDLILNLRNGKPILNYDQKSILSSYFSEYDYLYFNLLHSNFQTSFVPPQSQVSKVSNDITNLNNTLENIERSINNRFGNIERSINELKDKDAVLE
jgi:hypothetical protein